MSLAEIFQTWIREGQPQASRGRRDLTIAGTLSSVQFNKLVNMAQAATAQALGNELDQAAQRQLGSSSANKDARKNWKLRASRHFFQWLPAAEQDKITPGAPALRTGLMDAKSAELLGVAWAPAPEGHPAEAEVWLPPKAVEKSTGMTAAHRRKLSKELTERLVAEAETAEDVSAVLTLLQKQLARQFPESAASSSDCPACQRIAPALANFRAKLSGEPLHAFDVSVTTTVDTSCRKVRLWGLPISREKWRQAKAKDGVIKSRRGRKAKSDDPKVIQQVVDCILQHSQESSVWLKAEGRNARHLTTSLLRAYWDGNLCNVVAWAQFHKIVKTRCKWAIKPQRLTDYCDYCHLYESSILPGVSKLLPRSKTALESMMPQYFAGFQPAPDSDKVDELLCMRRFVQGHADKNRLQRERRLTGPQRVHLHETEAKLCHRMSWEIRVDESYRWHKLVSRRQAQAFEKCLQDLSPTQVLLWSDFKQNLTIPMAHAETGLMFYGTSRMEMTCWGCILFQKQGEVLCTKHILVLSSIIEHSTLVSNLLYKEVAKHIDNFDAISEVIAWSDCGPHYKSYDHCAGWIGEWVEASPNRTIRLCFFGEKHGKGQVDGLFGEVEGWLRDYLKTPGRRIAAIDEMEQVLRSYARKAQETSSGRQYVVIRWEPDCKPIGRWVLPDPGFQISKTYCLRIVPGNPRLVIRTTLIEDHTFADVVGHGQAPIKTYPKVEWASIEDTKWRQGFFSNRHWDKKVPKQGEEDTVMKRFDEHKRRRMKLPDLETAWARTARINAGKLLRRREKWQHMKEQAAAEDSSSSSSSSSTSQTSSEAAR